jgi:hypothetical protein
VLSVKKVSVPEVCGYGAKYGDLLEIQYTTSLSDGTMLDSSGITCVIFTHRPYLEVSS